MISPSTQSYASKICSLATVVLLGFLLIGIAGCAAPIKRFYPGLYFPEDRTYENKPLGFSLSFRGNWNIFSSIKEMDKSTREFALSLQKTGAELLFVGATAEGTQGTRAIATNLNMTHRSYAERIQKINAADIDKDDGITDFVTSTAALTKWQYTKGGFKFVEFFFTIDTYDIRIAFWTTPDLYDSFLLVYEDMISSLSVISHY